MSGLVGWHAVPNDAYKDVKCARCHGPATEHIKRPVDRTRAMAVAPAPADQRGPALESGAGGRSGLVGSLGAAAGAAAVVG